ncbi:hypothetical protein N8I77_006219 [Diaporthe amygdali]|uniref:Uncharacterized protein n=1 Tax=Phomopsis amygdali TaxID=1214568 RepID=A0AAD9W6D3_PHOAM|nr:hypothetical protein N8I77_006219 [Diaporthe amygdali]
MRLVNLYRVLATACVLVADSGVQGHKDDDDKTVTVTKTTPQTVTPTAVPIQATPAAISNASPSASPPPTSTSASTTPSQQNTPGSNDGNSTAQAAGPPPAAENPASGAKMTPAMNQGVAAAEPGETPAQAGSSSAAQMEGPSVDQASNGGPAVAAIQAEGMGMEMKKDPATGDLLGSNPPSKNVDLPVTIVYLLLFITGAFTHISIYRANAKRGHKFLLSDLMFDFCMIRTVTCIFRIIFIFSQLRGIILAAQIFFNGGASVIFAVNILLAQRIVRSMHPNFGWSVPFGLGTTVLAISVPPIIILQITSISLLFLSTDNPDRSDVAEALLKFGSSWNLWLVVFPFVVIFLSCSIPGPRPEKFGSGSLRIKTSLVMFAAALLATGATVRTYSAFNPRPNNSGDVLYGRPVFYVTQFTFELIVVALYAALRFDLLFHIPNGSSKPGDYSINKAGDAEKAMVLSRGEIRDRLEQIGIHHQILKPSYTSSFMQNGAEPVFAVFYPSAPDAASLVGLAEDMAMEGKLPPRPADRVSRRQSLMEAFRSTPSYWKPPPPAGSFGLPAQPRPPRPPRTTQSMYRTSAEDQSDR